MKYKHKKQSQQIITTQDKDRIQKTILTIRNQNTRTLVTIPNQMATNERNIPNKDN